MLRGKDEWVLASDGGSEGWLGVVESLMMQYTRLELYAVPFPQQSSAQHSRSVHPKTWKSEYAPVNPLEVASETHLLPE